MDTPAPPSGAELARRYWTELVAPLVLRWRPGLRHAAGLLGRGSEVLGLDDDLSRDHDWGPRLTLLVDGDDVTAVDALLARTLPDRFGSFPTRFAVTRDPRVRHRVEVTTPAAFVGSRLGVTGDGDPTPADWLTFTGQAVLEVTAGPVFADTHGELTAVRRRLAWYPDDVWRYVVAADWARLGEELPLAGRAGHRGDDVGSRVIAARLVGVLMHLGCLLERRWPPYPKWLGTRFATLPRAGAALPDLALAVAAGTWQDRERALCRAAGALHALQRDVGLPAGGDDATQPFHDRPFRGVRDEVATALLDAVADPRVRAFPPGVGSVEQWVDDVRVLTVPGRRAALVAALGAAR